MAAGWTPNVEGLQKILQLVKDTAIADNKRQRQIFDEMSAYQQMPDFNNYLAYIMAHLPGEAPECRQRAGLFVKGNVIEYWHLMDPRVHEYVKGVALQTITDEHLFVRQTAGSLISAIVSRRNGAELESWPQLLPFLVSCLDSGAPTAIDGALNALAKLCEDIPEQLDSPAFGRPLVVLLPKLMTFFAHSEITWRRAALASVNQFLIFMPNALTANMDTYLQGLFMLASDASPSVRQSVCQAFVLLVDRRLGALLPQLPNIVQFMIASASDPDDSLALEACEFWTAYCNVEDVNLDHIRAVLPTLIPLLMKLIVYSDMDLLMLSGADDEDCVPDKAEDVRPVFAHSRRKDNEDDDDDDDDSSTEWSLRKCAAAAFDSLAHSLGSEILPHVLPELNRKLGDLKEWRERESGILALGAIGVGCAQGLEAHLPGLVPYLLQLLHDPQALIRSIACWTVSRYADWILSFENDALYLQPLLQSLLERMLDRTKKVQETACSAFTQVVEVAGERLTPYLHLIVPVVMTAFQRYQAKNMLVLYDAIGWLCESTGNAMDQPALVAQVVPPLMTRYRELDDADSALWPLAECLGPVLVALRLSAAPCAEEIFARCVGAVRAFLDAELQAMSAQAAGLEVELPDRGFLVCQLDLLSSLAEGLGSSIESLVGRSNLVEMLLDCSKFKDTKVRQSAFALLGDLTKFCIGWVRPHLPAFIPLIVSDLGDKNNLAQTQNHALVINASWVLGEIAIKVGADLKPWVPSVLESVIGLFAVAGTLQPSVLDNVAITLGRLALASGDIIGPRLDKILSGWCYILARLPDDVEKMHAFHGLCLSIHANPRGALPSFPLLCDALASWQQQPPAQLAELFVSLLRGFKMSLGAEWPGYFDQCSVETRMRLQQAYGV